MMGENNNGEVSNAQIMHSIGLLTGTVQEMNKGMTDRLENMRRDIKRIEQASKDQVNRVEDNLSRQIDSQGKVLNKRIDDLDASVSDKVKGLSTRVTNLEAEDKKIIENVAKMSALGGGIGGALVTAAVELIKHI